MQGDKKMTTIKEREAVQDVLEQQEVEQRLEAQKKTRSRSEKTADKKKGQPVNWKPASRLPKIDAPEGFTVAWKSNTPENIRRLQLEGWEVANRIEHNMDVKMGDYYRKVNDSPTSEKESTIVHNELIAMVLPNELADARKEYYRQETEKQTRAKLMLEDNNSSIKRTSRMESRIEIN